MRHSRTHSGSGTGRLGRMGRVRSALVALTLAASVAATGTLAAASADPSQGSYVVNGAPTSPAEVGGGIEGEHGNGQRLRIGSS